MSRVIAGVWRGRRLEAPAGGQLRPTAGRVKGALFAILGGRVEGAEIADLCCGTGALGIEALSRGAALAHFVDDSPRALRAARGNLERCQAARPLWRLHRADAARWLAGWAARPPAPGRPRLVVADPPYASPLAAQLAALLLALPAAAGVTAAAIEHAPEALASIPPAPAWRVFRRRYGGTVLTVLED